MTGKRPPTHVGPRGEIRTPGRGVPTETLPPPRQRAPFDFEGPTPPAMDGETYRALQKIRDDMLQADNEHGRRISNVETGLTNIATAGTALANRMGGIETSHAGMEGEFRTLKDTIIKDRDDERAERKARADHRRQLALKVVGGLFSTSVLAGIIALIAKGC